MVTTRPSTTTSPLDSTISGSAKRNTTCPSSSDAGATAPEQERHGDDERPASTLTQAPGAPAARPAAGRIPQAATRSSYSLRTPPPLTGAAGADRAEHGVARGVLALDELHDVDAVALQPQQRGPQRVGEGVGEAARGGCRAG